jgi:hypothetical protein
MMTDITSMTAIYERQAASPDHFAAAVARFQLDRLEHTPSAPAIPGGQPDGPRGMRGIR